MPATSCRIQDNDQAGPQIVAASLAASFPAAAAGASEADRPAGREDERQQHDQRYTPINSLPYPSDRWLLERIAQWVLGLGPTAEAAALWQPVLDLVPARASWTENFLISFFFAALHADPTPQSLTEEWQSLLDYAEHSPHWKRADHDSWANLLAFDHLFHSTWEERHAPSFEFLQPHFESHLRAKLRWGSKFGGLLGLLTTPAAHASRTKLLPAIADAVKGHPSLVTRDESARALARFPGFLPPHAPGTRRRLDAIRCIHWPCRRAGGTAGTAGLRDSRPTATSLNPLA